MPASAEPTLRLLRTATRGPEGTGAMLVNAAAGVEPTIPWFEPRYWIARGGAMDAEHRRGAVLRFKQDGQWFALRHFRRGGLAAYVTQDQYLWLGEARTRPVCELNLLLRLQAAGLPVPTPIAARYVHDGLAYRGDLITAWIPDTQSLAERLAAAELGLATWAAIGRCIRRFHDYGLCHADLNAHNVLLRGESEVFLVDFDRCERRRPGLWGDANLARLRRSLDSLEDQRAARCFDDAQWHCLLSAYF